MSSAERDQPEPKVTLWLDPVCPFSWNTARWLRAVAEKAGLAVDWRLMSLAVLNEGCELPQAQQARMRDSQQVGRLMTAIAREQGTAGWVAAYFAFGERYFDRSEALDANLVAHVLMTSGTAAPSPPPCRTRPSTSWYGSSIRPGKRRWAKPGAARFCGSANTHFSGRS